MSIDNPYICIFCNHKYNEKIEDRGSTKMDEYCRFLGFCKDTCFNKLSKDLQLNNMNFAYEKGDLLKRRHKFYHTELPEFRKFNKPH